MKNNNLVVWTKHFNVEHEQSMLVMDVYLSSHTSGQFVGGVVYFEYTGGTWSKDQTPNFLLKLEQFVGRTEDEAYDQVVEWLDSYFLNKGLYKLELTSQ